MSETSPGSATAGGEHERTKTNAEHKRCLRGLEGSYTNLAVRKETVKGRYAEVGNRLHKLPQRAR